MGMEKGPRVGRIGGGGGRRGKRGRRGGKIGRDCKVCMVMILPYLETTVRRLLLHSITYITTNTSIYISLFVRSSLHVCSCDVVV